MWGLQNRTRFTAERAWVRDKNGAEVWIVVVKGTYLIGSDGSMELAEKQEDVCKAPKFLGEQGKSSLLYDSDLQYTKPGTDVLLHGHAYAPRRKQTTQLDVTIKIANIAKTLRVFGNRYWDRGLIKMKMTSPEPFEKMPIIYERAFGGVDKKSKDPKRHGWERRNPVGTGFAVEPKHLIGKRVPNIEFPKDLISFWNNRPRPAGFGPIAGAWSPRLELAGTYDERWEKERLPLLPDDFDDRFYYCAPVDQQTPEPLSGGETVALYNLTRDGVLRFQLPRVKLEFRTRFADEGIVEHRASLHTVILEPDVLRVIMVWHTALPCHPKVLRLEQTVVQEKKCYNPCSPEVG